jgi:hypothetical protein
VHRTGEPEASAISAEEHKNNKQQPEAVVAVLCTCTDHYVITVQSGLSTLGQVEGTREERGVQMMRRMKERKRVEHEQNSRWK